MVWQRHVQGEARHAGQSQVGGIRIGVEHSTGHATTRQATPDATRQATRQNTRHATRETIRHSTFQFSANAAKCMARVEHHNHLFA